MVVNFSAQHRRRWRCPGLWGQSVRVLGGDLFQPCRSHLQIIRQCRKPAGDLAFAVQPGVIAETVCPRAKLNRIRSGLVWHGTETVRLDSFPVGYRPEGKYGRQNSASGTTQDDRKRFQRHRPRPSGTGQRACSSLPSTCRLRPQRGMSRRVILPFGDPLMV